MRTPSHRLLAVCTTVVLVLPALAACAPTPTPAPIRTAAATDAPVFASDEEALAAAEKAYAAYQAMSDVITADGGAGASRIAPLASRKYLPELLAGFEAFAQDGRSSRGESIYDTVSLVRYGEKSTGTAEVDLYLCSDVSGVQLVDRHGTDRTPGGRANRIPLQVRLVSSIQDPSKLLIDREEVWSGANFC